MPRSGGMALLRCSSTMWRLVRMPTRAPARATTMPEPVQPPAAPLFAIGDPLGLARTYTSGTLSAIRHWETAEQIPVHLIRTDVTTGPGSSGGGVFHQDGHLVGIISFGKQGEHGDAAHFAISVASVRETLVREGVTFDGQRLT